MDLAIKQWHFLIYSYFEVYQYTILKETYQIISVAMVMAYVGQNLFSRNAFGME